MYTFIPTFTYIHTYMHKHIPTYIYTHTYIHTYTHTLIHTHLHEFNRRKYTRVQRLIYIIRAKATSTACNVALRTLICITPVEIKLEEAPKLYNRQAKKSIRKLNRKIGSNQQTRLKSQESRLGRHSDLNRNNKCEHGVGAGTAIFIQNYLAHRSLNTLHNNCSNNQAEQLEIFKAL